ncbi:hypothetical protein Bca4012_009388 [Brassica carinata]|uniref:Uncharacterized protein n=1 Tax=Brassica carinata TaxID=52824 RepID=A0A8X7UZN8_BRACI|nr:hypothetical protein Bca52824_034657 [Brassica carinata]
MASSSGTRSPQDDNLSEKPLSRDAAHILPLLQSLLLNNDIQRGRSIGLIQLFDPTAQINAPMNAEGEQIATEADLASQVHLLEQSVQNQKKANAQLEEEINRLTKSIIP